LVRHHQAAAEISLSKLIEVGYKTTTLEIAILVLLDKLAAGQIKRPD